jgi:hypothetical protein
MASEAYGATPRRRVMGPVIVAAVLATMAAPVLGALADTTDPGDTSTASAPVTEQRHGTLHAAVTEGGQLRLRRSSGALAAVERGRGVSVVRFERPVRRCGLSATVAAGSRPGLVSATPARSDARAVRVVTFAPGGSPAARDYHLVVTCPAEGS